MAANPHPAAPHPAGTPAAPERRPLKFIMIDDILREADRIAAAERAGKLRRTGNWTAGQTFGHIAGWLDCAFDGFPFSAPPELAARARARKDVALSGGMTPGFRIPGMPEGTALTEVLPLDVGLKRLQSAMGRLKAGAPTREHPFFGALTHGEWVLLQLRHSELHMGYFHPEGEK